MPKPPQTESAEVFVKYEDEKGSDYLSEPFD